MGLRRPTTIDAFASLPLAFGHLMLTASLDLVVWPLTVLTIIRALLRAQPRWWLVAGVIVGLSTYNKLLIGLLVAALVAGLIILGLRKVLWSKHLLMAAVIALILAGPNVFIRPPINGHSSRWALHCAKTTPKMFVAGCGCSWC